MDKRKMGEVYLYPFINILPLMSIFLSWCIPIFCTNLLNDKVGNDFVNKSIRLLFDHFFKHQFHHFFGVHMCLNRVLKSKTKWNKVRLDFPLSISFCIDIDLNIQACITCWKPWISSFPCFGSRRVYVNYPKLL